MLKCSIEIRNAGRRSIVPESSSDPSIDQKEEATTTNGLLQIKLNREMGVEIRELDLVFPWFPRFSSFKNLF